MFPRAGSQPCSRLLAAAWAVWMRCFGCLPLRSPGVSRRHPSTAATGMLCVEVVTGVDRHTRVNDRGGRPLSTTLSSTLMRNGPRKTLIRLNLPAFLFLDLLITDDRRSDAVTSRLQAMPQTLKVVTDHVSDCTISSNRARSRQQPHIPKRRRRTPDSRPSTATMLRPTCGVGRGHVRIRRTDNAPPSPSPLS